MPCTASVQPQQTHEPCTATRAQLLQVSACETGPHTARMTEMQGEPAVSLRMGMQAPTPKLRWMVQWGCTVLLSNVHSELCCCVRWPWSRSLCFPGGKQLPSCLPGPWQVICWDHVVQASHGPAWRTAPCRGAAAAFTRYPRAAIMGLRIVGLQGPAHPLLAQACPQAVPHRPPAWPPLPQPHCVGPPAKSSPLKLSQRGSPRHPA